MSNLISLSSTPATMTSREIAELVGKRHDNVMRDIRSMIEQLSTASGLSWFCQTEQYMDAKGESRDMYRMDKDTTYTLIAGYRADLRFKIIKRWQEIEAQIAQPQTKLSREDRYRLGVYRDAYKTAKLIGFEGNMALLAADNYCKSTLGCSVLAHMGTTHLIADPKGQVYTPTELGKLLDPPVSAVKFNLMLEAAGLQQKELGSWLPRDEAEGLFEWADTGKKHSLGTPVKQLRWFKDVLGRLPSEMVTTH